MTFYAEPYKIPYDEWFDDTIEQEDFAMPVDKEPQQPLDPEEEDITIHEKMYRIATSKYNPFSVQKSGGGSEISQNKG